MLLSTATPLAPPLVPLPLPFLVPVAMPVLVLVLFPVPSVSVPQSAVLLAVFVPALVLVPDPVHVRVRRRVAATVPMAETQISGGR